MSNSGWKNVTRSNPCKGCGKPDWCSESADGLVSICYRPELCTEGKLTSTLHDGKPIQLIDRRAEKVIRKTSQETNMTKIFRRMAKVEKCEDILPSVYESMISTLDLSKHDENSLLDRGFSESEISFRGYKSYNFKNDYRKIMLLSKKFSKESLLKVPGFYEKNGRLVFYAQNGIIVPVRNEQGRVVALKVRVPSESGKYRYISSKFKGGPSPGSPLHIPLNSIKNMTNLWVTEGEIKADFFTYQKDELCVSIPGVTSWRKVIPFIKKVKPKKVIVAFDSDCEIIAGVASAKIMLTKYLEDNNIKHGAAKW